MKADFMPFWPTRVHFWARNPLNRGEVLNASLDSSLTLSNNNSPMRTHLTLIQLSIGVEVVRFVRVRAYKRYRYGKLETVRSHYRRY